MDSNWQLGPGFRVHALGHRPPSSKSHTGSTDVNRYGDQGRCANQQGFNNVSGALRRSGSVALQDLKE